MKVLQWISSACWAVEGGFLERSLPVVQRRLIDGERLTAEEVISIVAARDARRAERSQLQAMEDVEMPAPGSVYHRVGSVALLPIGGVIAKHMSQVNGASTPAGTSVEALMVGTARAMADDKVKSVVLVIESPGGMVSGMPEFASHLRVMRQKKPVVAYADDLAASGGYWIASQAQRIFASGMAQTGSIGVYQVLYDDSAKVEKQGYKVHVLRAGAHKGEYVSGQPVPQSFIDREQAHVNAWYEKFIADVAEGRGMDPAKVRESATGEVWFPGDAKARGLVDGVADLKDVVAEMDRQYGTARTAVLV